METKDEPLFKATLKASVPTRRDELSEKIVDLCRAYPVSYVIATLAQVLVFGMAENLTDPDTYAFAVKKINLALKKGYKAQKIFNGRK